MRNLNFLRVMLASIAGLCLLVLAGWAEAHTAAAELRLPKALGSGMVLQRDLPSRVWGWAGAQALVSVEFAGKTYDTKAGADGAWQVMLLPMPANSRGQQLSIRSGGATVALDDVLVGDVWFCSGQSNMEYPMRRPERYRGPVAPSSDPAAEALAAGRHDGLRLFKVQKVLSTEDVTTTGWTVAEGEDLAKFSALAFFFAKEIHSKTGVPQGLIDCSWGGSRIEVWTPEDAYERFGQPADVPTTRPLFVDGARVARHYDRMVKPLVPFVVRGFLWYQGESNCMLGETGRYTQKQKALIASWRDLWQRPDAPFYMVQLAPYAYSARKQEVPLPRDLLPRFWEAQADVLSVANTEMVVTTDLTDNIGDIHPFNKWEIGRRLALIALGRDYGLTDVVYKHPVFESMEVRNGEILVRFTDVGGGLKTKDGATVSHFEVCGSDGRYIPAKAEIVSASEVRLTAAGVTQPTDVRFAWDERAQPNFVGGTGLPVRPFRMRR